MNDIIANVDWNVIIALGITVALVIFMRFVAPKLKNNKRNVYQETILILDIVNAVYNDDDVNKVLNITRDIVEELKELSVLYSNQEVFDAVVALIESIGIEIDENVLKVIVNTVVYYLS